MDRSPFLLVTHHPTTPPISVSAFRLVLWMHAYHGALTWALCCWWTQLPRNQSDDTERSRSVERRRFCTEGCVGRGLNGTSLLAVFLVLAAITALSRGGIGKAVRVQPRGASHALGPGAARKRSYKWEAHPAIRSYACIDKTFL